jgi:hypothetical protein
VAEVYESSGFIGFQIVLNRAIIDIQSKSTTDKDVRSNLIKFFTFLWWDDFSKKRPVYSIYERVLCFNSIESGFLELLN